ncbi:MAG: dihydropteroate synthase [Crocinitomicaceae bacterium]|nr:dihydropteroate synthase [Crocinitomicaceae bacterium]
MRLGKKLFSLVEPSVMGILNCTPDSFYKESRISSLDAVLKTAEKQVYEGASILDIGGYSSRPNAEIVSVIEEIDRTRHAITAIKKEFPDVVLSIDTFRSEVARIALESGADIINDISGGELEPEIWKVAAHYQCPYVLMHMRGNPKTMQSQTDYTNLFSETSKYYSLKIKQLQELGVHDIILDPGFGFAKTMKQNYELLNRLSDFHFLEKPILVGFSRKSMIHRLLEIAAEDALNGTTILNTKAILKGAKILRVHDVKEASEVLKLLSM